MTYQVPVPMSQRPKLKLQPLTESPLFRRRAERHQDDTVSSNSQRYTNTGVQSQKAVTAYLEAKQLLSFAFHGRIHLSTFSHLDILPVSLKTK